MPGLKVTARMDARSYNRAITTLKKWEGHPFRTRVIKAHEAGARLLIAPMRRVAPKRRGGLAKSISAKKAFPTPRGYIVGVGVKPRGGGKGGAHGHLLSKGHRVITPGGRNTGKSTPAHSFIQDTIEGHEDRVLRFIQEQSLNLEGATTSFVGGSIRSA